jgi:hypothetical protein
MSQRFPTKREIFIISPESIAFDFLNYLPSYNIVWDSPSRDSMDSMPLSGRLGAGRFIVNTLRIRENLGTDPAADRLLRNMLNYAARDLDKPPGDLPADFQQQLKTIGYE